MGLANSRALWTGARVVARSRRGTGAILAVRGPGRITATGVCRGFQRISVQEGGLLLVCFGDDRVNGVGFKDIVDNTSTDFWFQSTEEVAACPAEFVLGNLAEQELKFSGVLFTCLHTLANFLDLGTGFIHCSWAGEKFTECLKHGIDIREGVGVLVCIDVPFLGISSQIRSSDRGLLLVRGISDQEVLFY